MQRFYTSAYNNGSINIIYTFNPKNISSTLTKRFAIFEC